MRDVVTAILGGGQGSRLWPLTRDRAKPAVPVGGKFRLIDIPISNSLHAGVDQIYVLTQFNSASLHRHISQSYRFDVFSRGFVNILAAEQTMGNRDWYQGTADAVRQNLSRLTDSQPSEVLILSGDQLYIMQLASFVWQHRTRHADLTIAVKPVSADDARGMGIMKIDSEGRIVEFVEKPKTEEELSRLKLGAESLRALGFEAPSGAYLASMGIYCFRREVLTELLGSSEATDFGHEVIPSAIHNHRVFAFAHTGYWEDIGTIPSFHEANLQLTMPMPPLNLYSSDYPIFTHARFLPGTKINHCQVHQSILAEGSIISASTISDSIIGIRALVREGAKITRSIVMGASSFEVLSQSRPIRVGIGPGCEIDNAIIDLNAAIGEGSRIVNVDGVDEADGEDWAIRGGVVVIPRGATIPPGTVI